MGKVENSGCQVDESRGHTNKSKDQADASTVLNTGETTAMGDGDGTDARRSAAGPDGLPNQSNALSGHRDVPGSRNGTDTTADAKKPINAHRNTAKQPNSPGRWPTHNRVELRNRAGTPDIRRLAWHSRPREYGSWYAVTPQYRPAEPKPLDLPGAQGLAQTKRVGSGPTQARKVHE